MASFLEELWNSIFTPGPTPTLLIATNAAFAALQLLLFILLVATYSLHFLVLSTICGGLWYSINWFAAEIAREQKAQKEGEGKKEKSPEPDNASDTETENTPAPPVFKLPSTPPPIIPTAKSTSLAPPSRLPHDKPKDSSSAPAEQRTSDSGEVLRRRRSLGEGSGYISTDSEWEKVSEGEEKSK
ncbi:uncharacterized protein A1O9_01458 [Exophiala aquamarina CBS 119918]|uniref:Anaphase-promoting complex subunit 2 n=1 Tax=Exophiala aquamarina CBS 119918 TaxID=1182545 RepID=A0A072Q6C7_9EURO|nr:uncharacterized protein A1O9_01458 [Exophiala aquamarina CBS 119918]KEF63480.1 hypothetical protein A1O9_01458 [Exophiala aquamarina CBS 119918]